MSRATRIKVAGDWIVNDVLYVNEDANVGIGKDQPQARLDITGSSVGAMALNVNSILLVSGSTALPRIGIGDSTPDTALDINAIAFKPFGVYQTVASNAAGPGSGSMSFDGTYIYVQTGSAAGWVRISGSWY